MAASKKVILQGITQINRWSALLLAEIKDPILKTKIDNIQRETAEAQIYAESIREDSK